MIKFRGYKGEYGFLSNFYPINIEIDDKLWPSTEHYYQAMKHEDENYQEVIRTAPSAFQAFKLGRAIPARKDWDQIKEDVMRKAVFYKFSSYDFMKNRLIETGEQEIIEDSPWDDYWGCGKDGLGLNRLGSILMEARDFLKNSID